MAEEGEENDEGFGQMGSKMHADKLNQKVKLAILTHMNEDEENKKPDLTCTLKREISRYAGGGSSIRVVHRNKI